jgi:hypothetical protein
MNIILVLITLVISSPIYAQKHFKVPSDDRRITSLKNTFDNHKIILKTYRTLLDSQIKRLVTGLEYESLLKENKHKIKPYETLLVKLLIKKVFVHNLEAQLNKVNPHSFKRGILFNTENVKIDLSKEIEVSFKNLPQKDFGHYFLEDLKSRLIRETLSTVAVSTYQAVGSGLLTKIIANGVGQAAFKTALISMGSEIFVSVGRGSILTALTFPLHGYRAPPESIWSDILEVNPELIINPEWMKYAGCNDDPWFTHGYALLRRTDRLERAFNRFLDNEEKDFQSRVTNISNLKKIEIQKAESKPTRYDHPVMAVDGTYVHRNIYIEKLPPFWAQKKK